MAPLLALTAACASLLYTPTFPAQEAPSGAPRVRARLLLDTTALAPGGSTWGLLELDPQRGWHVYWRQPGDAGEPPRVEWALPAGLTVGELRHPAPELYREGPLVQFIHPGAVGLPFRLSAGADFAPPPDGSPTWKLGASASWLVCKDVCEFELAELSVELAWRPSSPAGPDLESSAPGNASIAAAVAKLPVRVGPADWSAARSASGADWEFELGALPAAAAARLPEGARTWRAFDRAEFFPTIADSIPFGAPVADLATRADSLGFSIAAVPPGPGAADARLRPGGVLVLRGPDDLQLALELSPPAASPPAHAPRDASAVPPSRSATF
ncbi:MAG: protein-disulfide reductase DsbD domain-containing protein [Planctomycetota bacterium]|jgi:thiol:disulfide interchange protein DsbD